MENEYPNTDEIIKESKLEDLHRRLETYLNDEVHSRCDYDIYSTLMDMCHELIDIEK